MIKLISIENGDYNDRQMGQRTIGEESQFNASNNCKYRKGGICRAEQKKGRATNYFEK